MGQYHLTDLPTFADIGLAKEEIVSIMCGSIHLSSKLANIRHISSRLIGEVLNCSPKAIHLYEVLILQNRECDILISTPLNFVQNNLEDNSIKALRRNLAGVMLMSLISSWDVYYSNSLLQLGKTIIQLGDQLITTSCLVEPSQVALLPDAEISTDVKEITSYISR